jgi:drug/metabolite transporter (DMT)-like permease
MTMSRFLTGNLFLLLSMLSAASGHVLVKGVVDEVKPAGLGRETVRLLLTEGRPLRGGLGAALIGAAFIFWVLCLLKLDLSYAYPVACSSVLLVAFFSAIFLGEPVSARTYLATALILVGIILLAPGR